MSADKLEAVADALRFQRVSAEFGQLAARVLPPHVCCALLRALAHGVEEIARARGRWDEGAYAERWAQEEKNCEAEIAAALRGGADA